MKTTSLFLLLLVGTLGFSSFLPSEVVPSDMDIEIPKDYTGWVEIVASSKETAKSKIIVDRNGVGYIDSTSLKDDVLFHYYQNGAKLTEHQLKFFYITKIVPHEYANTPSTDKDYIAHERKIYSFYVLNKDELTKGDEYWDSKKSQKQMNNKSTMHVNAYIRKGWIKVE